MAKKKLLLAHKLFSAMLSLLVHGRRPPPHHSSKSTTTDDHASSPVVHRGAVPPATVDAAAALVVDVDTALLRSGDLFPYFMLVALEAGGFLRGLLLLLLSPLIRLLLPRSAAVAAMAAVSFCGLRAGARFRAGRAVLPKWLTEDVAAEAFQAVRAAAAESAAAGRPSCASPPCPGSWSTASSRSTSALGVETVVAREMKVVWGFYTGFMEELRPEEDGEVVMKAVVAAAAVQDESDDKAVVGFSGSMEFLDHPMARCCKEIFVASSDEKSRWRPLARHKYPKPMVFHDGRLAFRPTATNTAAMFAWLPLGVALGAARLAVALTVPYRYSTPILVATGMSWRLKGSRPAPASGGGGRARGQLFVCNHRTLIDPVYVSVALDRQVRAVSYSLSRLSELISPIGRTVHLTRDRDGDGAAMARLLDRGDLVVVCPEGTTCREPYLLRFSPLFAELSDDVVPVGMANLVQRKMGEALGYGCTMLTRKDKYLMLAGNDGIVRSTGDKSASASVLAPSAAAGAAAAETGRKNKST